ncbi:hypothetical protein BM221_007235 [Beauveria bassiana]|uniref:Uncharacterized protein n=1 Tax=Beauveria bassiana TaxID=176275 RepID=A0A2N6NJW4_BEABA|nr:hypothetical protein BM221_007235 [Beauveria bassiana]
MIPAHRTCTKLHRQIDNPWTVVTLINQVTNENKMIAHFSVEFDLVKQSIQSLPHAVHITHEYQAFCSPE